MTSVEHEHQTQLRFLLATGRLRGAMEFLNLQSNLRYTALYRLGAGHAENFVLVDRDDADAALTDDIPLDGTYCVRVKHLADAFVTEDAERDPRLASHPSRSQVRAYCGVPLLDLQGEVFGTLCQFDPIATEISDHTLELMREVAKGLGQAAIAAEHQRHLMQRVEHLSDMQELILSTSGSEADTEAAFEDFAAPLRDEARAKLLPEQALAVEARIGEIWSGMRHGRAAPTVPARQP